MKRVKDVEGHVCIGNWLCRVHVECQGEEAGKVLKGCMPCRGGGSGEETGWSGLPLGRRCFFYVRNGWERGRLEAQTPQWAVTRS